MAKRKQDQAMLDIFCCPPKPVVPDGLPMPLHDVARAAVEKQARWAKEVRSLSVRFLEPFDAVVVERIVSIIQSPFGWNSVCGLQFVFDQAADADIRVAFVPGASWSHVGTDCLRVAPTEPTMNFGWLRPDTSVVEYHRVVLHEFGHALGLLHEHQSPYLDIPWDKDKVYAYYFKTNGWSKETVDHNVLKRYDKEWVDATPGDPRSIMCYLIDPLFLTDPMLNIGGNSELSPMDKAKVRELYGDPPASTRFLPFVAGGAVAA